jgi:phosphohistidine phosphatase SixA
MSYRYRSMLRVGLVGALLLAPAAAVADPGTAWNALREGGHVGLMRHADAPGGAGDPPGFTLEDCATQRNLSDKGTNDAVAVGEQMRARGVSISRILSSPWCRCLETARLLNLGPVEVDAAFSNAFVLRERRNELKEAASKVIREWTGGTLLVVTHGANILALTGHHPNSGEIVVVAPGATQLRAVGRISVPQ